MLKCEKYATEIAKGLTWDEKCDFIKKYILKKDDCSDMTCAMCREITVQWLLEEYIEEINWLKVPVNTPVLTKDNDDEEWECGFFVCYMPNNENYKFAVFSEKEPQDKANYIFNRGICRLDDSKVDPTPYLK